MIKSLKMYSTNSSIKDYKNLSLKPSVLAKNHVNEGYLFKYI